MIKAIHIPISAALLAGALLLTGCEKRMTEEYTDPYDAAQPVSFTTRVEDKVTRGTPVNNVVDLASMGVFCAATGGADWDGMASFNKMFNRRLNNNSGVWIYEGADVFWDARRLTDRYSFFAYTPYATAENGITVDGSEASQGKPVLRYTVPADVTMQPDLMLAVPRYNIRPTGNAVTLQMKHALTCIGFQIAGDGEQITGISLSGVSVTGEAVIDGGNITWSNLDSPTAADFTASLNYDEGKDYFTATDFMSANLIAADGYLMMIPQTLGSDAKITITFKDNTTTAINLNTHTWEAGKRISYSIALTPAGSIVVTPNEVILPSREVTAATDNVEVFCTKINGTPHPTALWTLTSSNPEWFRLSLDPNAGFESAGASVTGRGALPVYTLALANSSTATERLATINMGSVQMASVRQLKTVASPAKAGTIPGTAAGTYTYVGAFWRAGETGERVININLGSASANAGTWTAWIDWVDPSWGYDGFALLSGGSADEQIYTGTPGEAEDFQVGGSATAIRGTVARYGNITFRIGLRKSFTAYHADNHPARYAVLLLAYGSPVKVQKIFLRQGEGADYVMTNSDPISSGTVTTRTKCVRFSPYNLTATTLDAQVDIQGAVPAVNPATFTAYPTQAGAFFQWSYDQAFTPSRVRWAFNPSSTATAVSWGTTVGTTPWDFIAGTQEISPSGYRRINDGATAEAIPANSIESELKQSLWRTAFTIYSGGGNVDNSVYGYYADGFFDRRAIVRAVGLYGEANTAVSVNNNDVAYVGRLYFNPVATGGHYNASLFFPTAGYRNPTSGALNGAGLEGYYWSSSMTAGGTSGTALRNRRLYSTTTALAKRYGMAIRPVRQP